MSSPPEENQPLLPPSAHLDAPSRSKLQARRYLPEPKSDKARGKQRAVDDGDHDAEAEGDEAAEPSGSRGDSKGKGKSSHDAGRAVTVIFSDDAGNLEVWVDDGESVGRVKDQIRHMRPSVAGLQLRLIHAGRLLTDGILLLPWLRSLEERVKRQAAGVGGDVGQVLREVGLAEVDRDGAPGTEGKVYLHCNVGGPLAAGTTPEEEVEAPAPRRRGFDTLLDAGLSPEDVANMRRQFYESRGEEVPDLGANYENDEHARALEEQWIEGDLTPETATTSSEGMYASILHGLLVGFLVPLTPWFFFRDAPLPNFFDAEAEADEAARREDEAARAEDERLARAHAASMSASGTTGGSDGPGVTDDDDPLGPQPPQPSTPPPQIDALAPPPAATAPDTVSTRVSSSPLVGSEVVPSVVFGTRMQIGIVLGTVINVLFGALRFLNS